MIGFLKKQPPLRLIALGFLLAILIGSGLLMLPICHREGIDVSYIDALYTATSAVCITGLLAVDTGLTFNPLGQFIIAFLIQIGGLGITTVGAGIILAAGQKMDLKSRNLVHEAMNLDSGKGAVKFIRDVFIITFSFEAIGAAISFISFSKYFPIPKAIGASLFHAVAAFNNAGFDNLGNNLQNLIPYRDDVILNLVTTTLIFFGGIGFLVIKELITKKFRWKKLSMHARVVLSVSIALTVGGTLLIKLTEGDSITWLAAFFSSVSARTAGFSTVSFGAFSNAGIMVMSVLMFIGASPGSTGGGVKTSTLFVLIKGLISAATGRSEKAFHYSIPKTAFRKAAIIVLFGLSTVILSSFFVSCLEPGLSLRDIIFEMISAFGTVGLSTGITPSLSVGSKIISILVMYIGRIGPLTVASMWYFSKGERISYPEGNITIG